MIKLFGVGDDKNKSDNYKNEYEDFEDTDEENLEQEQKDSGQVALDIIEKSDEIIIIAPIAGVDLDNIDISIQANILTISGERTRPSYVYAKSSIIRNSECFWGTFTRDVILPENLDFDSIKATLEKNILIISIPKLRFYNQSIKVEKLDF